MMFSYIMLFLFEFFLGDIGQPVHPLASQAVHNDYDYNGDDGNVDGHGGQAMTRKRSIFLPFTCPTVFQFVGTSSQRLLAIFSDIEKMRGNYKNDVMRVMMASMMMTTMMTI